MYFAAPILLLLLQTPSQPKPIEFQETTLSNGLRVITHEDHSTPVANVQLHMEGGTLKSIPRIRPDDLRKFRDTYYVPNLSSLAIVGDLPTSQSFKLAEEWFGGWTKKDVPPRNEPEVPKPAAREIVIVDKPDAVQTEIRVGQTTVGRKDPDYFNVLVGSYILGKGLIPRTSAARFLGAKSFPSRLMARSGSRKSIRPTIRMDFVCRSDRLVDFSRPRHSNSFRMTT